MKIHVRRRHIERGKRGKSRKCPIALAVEEETDCRPSVGTDHMWLNDEDHLLSRTAMRFIARFDAGLPVKPFAFVLK